MNQIEAITRHAVREGHTLAQILDIVLCGVVDAALIANHGNQTAVARLLDCSRDTVRKRAGYHCIPIDTSLTYMGAWHYATEIACKEAVKIHGTISAAARALDCSRGVFRK